MRRRARRSTMLAGAVVTVGVAAVAGARLSGPATTVDTRAAPREPAPTAPAPAPTTTTVTVDDPGGSGLRLGVARPVGSPALIADAVGPRLALYSRPDDPQPGDVIPNPTVERLPLAFLVVEHAGDWLRVQLARRPNEATAWVRAADVSLRTTPYKVTVDTAARRLTVTDMGAPVLDVPVAVGTGGTPTPVGTFFVDGIVRLINPSGPYGAYQVSVAAFSDVLRTFGGGIGQIAIHGTNAPGLVGSAVSHGCVRMTNADVIRLATTVPVGTPVEIRP